MFLDGSADGSPHCVSYCVHLVCILHAWLSLGCGNSATPSQLHIGLHIWYCILHIAFACVAGGGGGREVERDPDARHLYDYCLFLHPIPGTYYLTMKIYLYKLISGLDLIHFSVVGCFPVPSAFLMLK